MSAQAAMELVCPAGSPFGAQGRHRSWRRLRLSWFPRRQPTRVISTASISTRDKAFAEGLRARARPQRAAGAEHLPAGRQLDRAGRAPWIAAQAGIDAIILADPD